MLSGFCDQISLFWNLDVSSLGLLFLYSFRHLLLRSQIVGRVHFLAVWRKSGVSQGLKLSILKLCHTPQKPRSCIILVFFLSFFFSSLNRSYWSLTSFLVFGSQMGLPNPSFFRLIFCVCIDCTGSTISCRLISDNYRKVWSSSSTNLESHVSEAHRHQSFQLYVLSIQQGYLLFVKRSVRVVLVYFLSFLFKFWPFDPVWSIIQYISVMANVLQLLL